MSNASMLEKHAKKAQKGEYLKSILNQFCEKNNIPYPTTVLPQRNGMKISIHGRDYQVCDSLVLSWGEEESAILKDERISDSYLETRPPNRVITDYTSPSGRRVVPPKKKSFRGHISNGHKYSLTGIVNNEQVELIAKVTSGTQNKISTRDQSIKSKKIPEKIVRLDDLDYWFITDPKN